MSLSVTTAGRGLLLQALFTQDYSRPDHFYWTYTTEVPVINAGGWQLAEPTHDPDYARAGIALTSAQWGSTGYDELVNAVPIEFPEPTVDWGLILGIAMLNFPYLGEGFCVVTGSVVEPFYVAAGDPAPVLQPGDVMFGLYE